MGTCCFSGRCPPNRDVMPRRNSRARNRLARSGRRHDRRRRPRHVAGHAERERNECVQQCGPPASEAGKFIICVIATVRPRDAVGMIHTSPGPGSARGGSPIACPSLPHTAHPGNSPSTHQRHATALSVLTDGGPAKLRLEKPGEGCQSLAPMDSYSRIRKATTT